MKVSDPVNEVVMCWNSIHHDFPSVAGQTPVHAGQTGITKTDDGERILASRWELAFLVWTDVCLRTF